MKKHIFYIIFFLYIIDPVNICSQTPYVAFEHLNIEDGMSTNFFNTLFEDEKGYLWFGSDNGLERYDGYTFKKIFSEEDSLKYFQSVTKIFLDKNNNLWIGSKNALTCYNRRTGESKFYLNNIKDTIAGFGASLLTYDSSTNSVFGFSSRCLFKFNLTENKIKYYYNDENNPKSIHKSGLMDIIIDKNNEIFLTCWDRGISKYNKKTDDFTHYCFNKEITFLHNIFDLEIDDENNIWLCSLHDNGIQKFNTKTLKCTTIIPEKQTFKNNNFSVKYSNNQLWITNTENGLWRYDIKNNQFGYYQHENDNPESFSESRAGAGIYKDSKNFLWISSLNKGINQLNLNLLNISNYQIDKKYSKKSTSIQHFLYDHNNNYWVCNYDGVFKYNQNSKSYIKINLPGDEEYSRLLNLNNDEILVNSDKNLYLINSKTLETKKVKLEICENKTPNISATYIDNENRLWVFSDFKLFVYENGIYDKAKFCYMYDKTKAERYIYCNFLELNDTLIISVESNILKVCKNNLKVSFLSNLPNVYRITSLYKSKDSIYFNNVDGYYSMDMNMKKISAHKYKFLGNNEVVPMCHFYNDSMQCITTYRGIYLYNIFSKEYLHPKIYNNDRINPDRLYISSERNKLFLAAGNGFVSFDPNVIGKTRTKPRIEIVDIYLFNKSININDIDSPIKESISYAKQIILDHTQNVFSLELSLLNFDEVHKNQYAYKLEGFDEKWNYIGHRKVASFTNLSPGNYTFKCKGFDKNNTESEIKELHITILPPFWATWWFRTMMIFLFILLLYVAYKLRIRNIKKRQLELEQQVILRTAEIQAQKEEILAQKEEIEVHEQKIIELFEDMKDSITTAQRIQESILPPESLIKQCLPNSFVLYLPKDIVSGDFYWFHVDVDRYYIAAVDCTGHGVAGAFMSLIAHNLLTKIINENKKLTPKEVLDKLNLYVIQVLNQEGENPISKDGMDISICMIHKNKQELEFAGANNGIYHFSNGELTQIKASKNSIGIQPMGKMATFENNVIQYQKGDKFYMYSDGFAGQLGGVNGLEKMKYNRFRDCLAINLNLDEESQKQALYTLFQTFKGEYEQTDDILVIGFEL